MGSRKIAKQATNILPASSSSPLSPLCEQMIMMSKKPAVVKYTKAPQAPRRFKSSYMFFSTEKHKQLRKELAANGENDKVSKD